jgi:hypothetical protein
MNRKDVFTLVDNGFEPVDAFENAGHVTGNIRTFPLGGGEYAEVYECLVCGLETEFVFSNKNESDISLHGLYSWHRCRA